MVLASRSIGSKLLKRSGGALDNEFAKLHASQIFDLARDGDSLAGEAITYTAILLADTIADIALLFNPEIVDSRRRPWLASQSFVDSQKRSFGNTNWHNLNFALARWEPRHN